MQVRDKNAPHIVPTWGASKPWASGIPHDKRRGLPPHQQSLSRFGMGNYEGRIFIDFGAKWFEAALKGRHVSAITRGVLCWGSPVCLPFRGKFQGFPIALKKQKFGAFLAKPSAFYIERPPPTGTQTQTQNPDNPMKIGSKKEDTSLCPVSFTQCPFTFNTI